MKISLNHPKKILLLILTGAILMLFCTVHATEEEKQFTNSLDMTFVRIPPGTFTMGSPSDEQDRRRNEVAHEVAITRPFYMQTTEMTVKQWREVMGKRFFFRKKGSDDMPVVKVSWEDCMEFITKLNALNEGVYRLPTEAEWEYACKGGGGSVYGWGNVIDCSKAMYANNTLKSSGCVEAAKRMGLPPDDPAPVKTYAPNAWGLYDMTGNVWEWCQDWFGPYGKDPVVDPKGPKKGTDKVRRGGSWYGPGERCRCANRNFSHPANRYQTTGFRLVREVE